MESTNNIAAIDGYDIQYWTYGDTTSRPIVMVHGFTGSHEGFQYIVPLLAKTHHVIIPDLPGFGLSELGDENWGVDEIARRTNQLVASLKLKESPHVVAHSMGGLIAASMLSRQPELYAKKTVFVSPAVDPIGVWDSRFIGAWLGGVSYQIGKTVPLVGPRIVTSRTLSRIATKLMLTTNDKALKKQIYLHHFKNLNYISSISFYHKIHQEIIQSGTIQYKKGLRAFDNLIVVGSRDIVTPLASQQRLQAAIHAELKVIPNVGHLLHYEAPRAVADEIISWL